MGKNKKEESVATLEIAVNEEGLLDLRATDLSAEDVPRALIALAEAEIELREAPAESSATVAL
jgi:hypothetical protein